MMVTVHSTMAGGNSVASNTDTECTLFRKSLSMLFQKSSFIAQNYPSYLCRKVFWENGNLIEICRKKDMPQKHAGPGAQALIVIYGDGELEWWVAGELVEKTSIRQISDQGPSSGIREQWLKRYLSLLGEQYGICPGIGLFDGEDISRCCNTTDKLFPFRRTVAVNCARWINSDIERCVPCSKEYEIVKHFLQQQGKLQKDDNEEPIEVKMSSVFEVLEDFPHLACRRITHDSMGALEIKVIVGDINVGPQGKQFSLQLSRIVILKSGQMKMYIVSEVVQDVNLNKDGSIDLALLRDCLSSLGRDLTACPGFMEHTFGVSHVSYKPRKKTEDDIDEPKQYAILTCKRSKQWMNVSLIISSLFNAQYPVCQMANMICQCQGCYVILQQMKDKWPDVFQLFISSKEIDLGDIIQQNKPDSSEKESALRVRTDSAVSTDSNPIPICISPNSEQVQSSLVTTQQPRILQDVASSEAPASRSTLNPVVVSENSDDDAEVTSSTVLKEIKMEEVVNSLSPKNPHYSNRAGESRINPEITSANTPNFPADLNDLLGIYIDLFDQYPDLIYRFEMQSIAGYRLNPYAHANQALVVKRRLGDVLDYHLKFHPTLKKPMFLASINIYLDGVVEFIVTGHRKFVTRVTHGGPSRDVINGYLSLLRNTYTFCGGISLNQWMSILPNVRPASVPNLISLDYPYSTFLDENCARWYEYKEADTESEPDIVHRCQLCQALLERLQYTQAIIHNTAIHFTAAAQPPVARFPSEIPSLPPRSNQLDASYSDGQSTQLAPNVSPPEPRSLPSEAFSPYRPVRPPPPLHKPPALRAISPASRSVHHSLAASQTLQDLCTLVKDMNASKPKPPLPALQKHTENVSSAERKQYTGLKKCQLASALKRPLPEDPTEYNGIELKRPVLRVRRLSVNELPSHEQCYIEALNESKSEGSKSSSPRPVEVSHERREQEMMTLPPALHGSVMFDAEVRKAHQLTKPSSGKKPKSKRSSRNVKCMKCDACLRKTGCGKCDFCLNPEWKQKCRLRQCPFKSPFCVEKASSQTTHSTTGPRKWKQCGGCEGCLRDNDCNECDFCLGKGDQFRYDKCEKRVCWDIITKVELRELAKFPGFLEEDDDSGSDDNFSQFL